MVNRSSVFAAVKRGSLGLAVAMGLGLCLAAHAQSSVGHVTGKGVAGDTVVVQGIDGGFNREITLKKDGKYQLRSVSPGSYNVTVRHADGTSDSTRTVLVKVGSTARVQ